MAMLPLGAALFFSWPAASLPVEGVSKETLSTMVFAAIVCMQMANAFECRATPASLFAIGPLGNRLLLGAVAAEGLALLLFVYVPVFADALSHQALTAAQWPPVLAAPVVLVMAEEGRKAIVRRRQPRV